MTRFIANARMYSVTPEAEAAWRELLLRIAESAKVEFEYVPYPAPKPMEALWERRDLGTVFMCGYPIALGLSPVVPIAAPIPRAPWALGRAVYRTDLIVHRDSPYKSLPDTFGGRLGWTVEHSHSGFNALRHHLLRYRSPERPRLYAEVIGNLITARRVLDAVVAGEIDVGPLDAYWHMLISRTSPSLTAQVRVIESTETAPCPAFVAVPALTAGTVARLKESFAKANEAPWFAAFGDALCLDGFAVVAAADFAPTLAWDREAKAAGYPYPA
jgi:ABC-type phosphate/phosphonate transport system substrate-binding protein